MFCILINTFVGVLVVKYSILTKKQYYLPLYIIIRHNTAYGSSIYS